MGAQVLLCSALLLLCSCFYSAPVLALHLLFPSLALALFLLFTSSSFALLLLFSRSSLASNFAMLLFLLWLLLFSCSCSCSTLSVLFSTTERLNYTYFVHQFKFELFASFENIFVLFAVCGF